MPGTSPPSSLTAPWMGLLGLVLLTIAGISLVWPALQPQNHQDRALRHVVAAMKPGDLLLYEAPDAKTSIATLPGPVAALSWHHNKAWPPELSLFDRVIILSQKPSPLPDSMELQEETSFGLWTVIAAQPKRNIGILGTSSPSQWTLSMHRRGQQWPCPSKVTGEAQEFHHQCPRSGEAAALITHTPWSSMHSSSYGDLTLHIPRPRGAHTAWIRWKSKRLQTLTIKTQRKALKIVPGFKSERVLLSTQEALQLLWPAQVGSGDFQLQINWLGEKRKVEKKIWETQVAKGRALLQEEREREALMFYVCALSRDASCSGFDPGSSLARGLR